MIMRPAILVTLALATGLAVVVAGTHRLAAAHRHADDATARLAAVSADASELHALRESSPSVVTSAKPSEDLLAEVNQALGEAGVSSANLGGLADEGAVSAGRDSKTIRLSYRLTLNGIELPELGRLLDVWRRDHAVWTPTQIDLQASPREVGRYDARIQLSTLYAEGTP